MADSDQSFGKYLEGEIEKYREGFVPLRTDPLRRLLIRHAPCAKLHPNPDDEFCSPEVGPSYRIINEYVERYLTAWRKHEKEYCSEPVVVERVQPDGYVILNGHHRWAAAVKLGSRRIPIRIVNLTQEKDIQKMILGSKNTKRVVLDLDEVVFCPDDSVPAEKPLGFPFYLIYREPLRRGIPELFNRLAAEGYDIWVYSRNYYSFDHIRRYFRRHRVHVTGVITGIMRKTKSSHSVRLRVEAMFSRQYSFTVHIDDSAVLRIRRGSRDFEDHRLRGEGPWAQEVIDAIEGMDAHEEP